MAKLIWIDLAQAGYGPTLELQRRLAETVQSDAAERAFLLTVEHVPAAVTLGQSGRIEHVRVPEEALAGMGIELHRTDRGGDVTYHGPGQLVCYPIIRVDRHGRDIRGHVWKLEEAVIRLLGRLGIPASRASDARGAWVGGGKIAAVGVRIRRWVSYHGVALNVGPDLSGFDLIVPCGLAGRGVTSVSRELGRRVDVDDLKHPMAECLAEVFGFAGLTRRTLTDVMAAPLTIAAGSVQALKGDPSTSGGGRRFPPWLTKSIPAGAGVEEVRLLLGRLKLATVCSGARCPNLPECFARRTATFLILGDRCTRSCRFCAIGRGPTLPPRADEPEAVAEACRQLGLAHVVITSVTRDDLPDGGAGHFARTIAAVRRRLPAAVVEVLTPDFGGDMASLETVLAGGPDVFNHNVETVPRLYEAVRPEASYGRSLALLARASERRRPDGRPVVKSGLMLGLGETADETRQVLRDLRSAGCDVVTIGQYLAPTPGHAPVARFVEPSEFAAWRTEALAMGFAAAAAGPFVRSSYLAEDVFREAAAGAAGRPAPA